ncbi:MAG TPA: RNA-binding S4 domain-containing protein [Stellaceae bacterium]|nr:RNA-binding S4 domain-containing protein [Stellaceae bacterium]
MIDRPPGASLRLDKWLWFARLAKSRSLAAKLCAAGAVAVCGTPAAKAHQAVRVGDVVTVPRGRLVLTVRVLALGARRGPAREAQRLYQEEARREVLNAAAWTPLLEEVAADS